MKKVILATLFSASTVWAEVGPSERFVEVAGCSDVKEIEDWNMKFMPGASFLSLTQDLLIPANTDQALLSSGSVKWGNDSYAFRCYLTLRDSEVSPKIRRVKAGALFRIQSGGSHYPRVTFDKPFAAGVICKPWYQIPGEKGQDDSTFYQVSSGMLIRHFLSLIKPAMEFRCSQ